MDGSVYADCFLLGCVAARPSLGEKTRNDARDLGTRRWGRRCPYLYRQETDCVTLSPKCISSRNWSIENWLILYLSRYNFFAAFCNLIEFSASFCMSFRRFFHFYLRGVERNQATMQTPEIKRRALYYGSRFLIVASGYQTILVERTCVEMTFNILLKVSKYR